MSETTATIMYVLIAVGLLVLALVAMCVYWSCAKMSKKQAPAVVYAEPANVNGVPARIIGVCIMYHCE